MKAEREHWEATACRARQETKTARWRRAISKPRPGTQLFLHWARRARLRESQRTKTEQTWEYPVQAAAHSEQVWKEAQLGSFQEQAGMPVCSAARRSLAEHREPKRRAPAETRIHR